METIKQRTKKDIYDQEYKKNNYDQVAIRVKKGKREEYQQAAENFGLGYGEMIRCAIEDFIKRHAGEEFPPQRLPECPPEKFTPEQKRLVEEFNQLSAETQKALVKLVRTINESRISGDNAAK